MSAPESMDGWVRACRLAQLGEDQPVHADIGRCPVCLVRTGGAVYAPRDECTHQAVPLSDGELTGGAIECWLHGSRFDLATGRVLSPPATRPVAIFAVRVAGGTSSFARAMAGASQPDSTAGVPMLDAAPGGVMARPASQDMEAEMG